MRITRLHIILLGIIVFVIGMYVLQIQQAGKQSEGSAAVKAMRQTQRRDFLQEKKRLEQEKLEYKKKQEEQLQKKKQLAVEAVAVAGEYWLIAKKEGRDYTIGQATLRKAKQHLKQQGFEDAWKLARQSIVELKAAPSSDKRYKVKRGDSLWMIAKMPRHYGRGAEWVRIWRANQKKISDFDLIYPRQVLLIPKK